MRHDAERPSTTAFDSGAPIPDHWSGVLDTMRANPFTRLSSHEVRAEAPHLLILSPTAEVAHACFAELLTGAAAEFVEIMTAEAVVAENVPAGTWIFLPHRTDGWTELETTSARVRAKLVAENTDRDREAKLTLIEYGINLWLWAEPPSSGGDPVCHAGELISWESAWALGDTHVDSAAVGASTATDASVRPPIYFGLPPVLRQRRARG
ncbi:MAG: hypothetical protein ACTH1C_06980 [Brevibacterium linens]